MGLAPERKAPATRGWYYDPRWAIGEPVLGRTPKDPLGAVARFGSRAREAEAPVLHAAVVHAAAVARAFEAAVVAALAGGPLRYL